MSAGWGVSRRARSGICRVWAHFPSCALWEFGAGSALQNLLSILAAGYAARGVARAVPASSGPRAAIGITRHRTPGSAQPAPGYQPGMASVAIDRRALSAKSLD
jgi:hypothetical protein